MDIQLTANAGIIIDFSEGSRVLIDALHVKKTRFSGVPEKDAKKLIGDGKPAACMLVTHGHADHFDAELVEAYLAAHPRTIFAGPMEVPSIPRGQKRILEGDRGEFSADHVSVSWMRARHEGDEYADVANCAYRVQCKNESCIVLGDAAVNVSKYVLSELTKDGPADAAVLNFPMLTLGRGRHALEGIHARELLGFHLPFEEDDTEEYRKSAKRAVPKAEKQIGLPVSLLLCPSQRVHIGPESTQAAQR